MQSGSRLGTLVDSAAGNRQNGFTAIRLLAALAVVLSHSFQVSTGLATSQPLHSRGVTLGGLAVDVFFVTSGFLVTRSLVRGPSIPRFVRARAARVGPGLVAVVLLTTAVVAATRADPGAFLSATSTWQYVVQNAVPVRTDPTLGFPGVLVDVPLPGVVNGSLWTLAHEIRLYLLLALAGAAVLLLPRRARSRTEHLELWSRRLGPALLVVVGTAAVVERWASHDPGRVSSGWTLAAMFVAGVTLHAHRDRLALGPRPVLLALAVLALGFAVPPLLFAATLMSFPLLLAHLAYGLPRGLVAGPLERLERAGDPSYGVYVYAWPVQQTIVALIPGIGPWALLALTTPVVVAAGYASWHLLESRFVAARRKTYPASPPRGCAASISANHA